MAKQSGTVVLQNAATATGNGEYLNMSRFSKAAFQVILTGSAVITFEASINASNWVTYALSDVSNISRTRATTQSTSGIFIADDAAGIQFIRARISTYGSGAVTVLACGCDQ
jgi:hypothetical protein